MSDKPKLAIIGAGGWGGFLTDCALRSPDWEIVAVADANPEALKNVQERGVDQSRCFSAIDTALDAVNPDAATVSIPNPVRVPYLLRLLESGASVVADKPVVHTIENLHQIQAALKKGGGTLMAGQNYRFDPDVRAMREVIASKVYGELEHVLVKFSINARWIANMFYRNIEGGTLILIEMCIHHFDMMRYLFGCDPETVYGDCWHSKANWVKGNTQAHALITFANGTRLTYDADYSQGNLTDWGADWSLCFEKATIQWSARTRKQPEIFSVDTAVDTAIWPDLVAKYPSSPNFMQLVFNEFAAAYKEKRQPECCFADNTRTLAMSHAIMESGKTGQPVNFADFLRREGL